MFWGVTFCICCGFILGVMFGLALAEYKQNEAKKKLKNNV